jgi:large subunit ribosomal protein L37Ae
MSKDGRETGSAGRFGPRYGRVSRRRVAEIEADTNADHTCPDCGAERVSRAGTGIWECSRCDHTFAGGAYRPETPGGRAAERSITAALSEGEEEDEE